MLRFSAEMRGRQHLQGSMLGGTAEPVGHNLARLPCPAEAHSRSGAGSLGSLACMPGRVLSSSVQGLSPQKTVGPMEGAPPHRRLMPIGSF